jgi:FKBP12-rapamycin complex-associated protein
MQDHSSASKQRISLKTLGQIAGSTGYVISPYLDYPQLLSQATDVLPGTKRAPWVLRREVIRTLGILGALDPDHYHTSVPKTSKGGAVGGGYFIEQDGSSATLLAESTKLAIETVSSGAKADKPMVLPGRESIGDKRMSSESISEPGHFVKEADDDMPVYIYMYEQYAMVAQPDASLPPQRRMTPADEDFYPTVTIQALTRIFKDPSLAVHHGMVMQAIMYIFESLGLRCVPYLKQVVPHILYTIKTCNPSALREALLKQVATLSGIVMEHLRPYVADIFDIVDRFWSSRHLETILYLISRIAVGAPDEFRKYVPRLVKKILASIEEIQVSDWLTPYSRADVLGTGPLEMRKLTMILSSVRSLQGVLGDFLHMLVPALLKLAGSLLSANSTVSIGNPMTQSNLSHVALLTIETVSVLLEHDGPAPPARTQSFTWVQSDSDSFPRGCSLPARAAQPLVRLLGNEANAGRVTGYAIIQALCVCAQRLGYKRWMSLYHEVVRNAICHWQARVGLDTEGVSARNNNSSHRDDLSLNGLNVYDQVVDALELSHTRGTPNNSFRLQPTQTHVSLLEPRNIDESVHLVDTIANFGDRSLATSGVDIALDNLENGFQSNPALHPVPNNVRRHLVNQGNLQRAWDVSQRASREDWDEWMRRFGLQLLREAPSPSLRASAQLAHAYQPLARELFSAAFFCCWEELSEQYRANLIYALEAAFVADISPEILQTLLNLAEFMEHDGVESGLPIDISILANLALKCRAYAKALHYNEREYNMGGADASCVETLISINNKLDLPGESSSSVESLATRKHFLFPVNNAHVCLVISEAALGVLKSARFHLEANRGSIGEEFSSRFLRHDQRKEMLYSVVHSTDESGFRSHEDGIPDFKESWLAKLGSWSEALVVYEEKLRQNPHDFDAILGSMRCFDATGEWQRVLVIAETSWPAISASADERGQEAGQSAPHSFSSLYIAPRAKRKALKFCAQAAWRLGQWTELEKCASQLVKGNETSYAINTAADFGDTSGDGEDKVRVNFDGAFYTAVLHIHRKEWSLAAGAIDAARMAMDSRFTALMAESYKRAYPGMVTAQTLAEMEEIIAYRKLEDCAATDVRKHPANRADLDEARSELLSIWRDRLAGCRVDADVHSPIMAVRSLVLSPTDDVEATLTLSELSRQAHRYKLAERVLLDPLNDMGARLDGIVFGYSLPDSLNLGLISQESGSTRNADAMIDRLLTKDASAFLPKYGSAHAQCSKMLVQEASGLSR